MAASRIVAPARLEPTVQTSPFWRDRIMLVLLGTAFVVTGWYALELGSLAMQVIGFWLVQILLDVAFTALCWRVANLGSTPSTTRRFWRGLTLGSAFFLAGDGAQALVSLGNPVMSSTNAGTVQAVLVALGVAVSVIAMLTHPMKVSGRERLRFALDAGTTMLGAGIFIWYFSVSEAAANGASLSATLLGSALMLVCTFSLLKLLLGNNPPFTRRAGILGGVSTGLAGLSTGLGNVVMESSNPSLGLALRLLPCVLLVASPRLQLLQVRADPDVLDHRRRRLYSLIPYTAVAAAQALLVFALFSGPLNMRVWGVVAGVVVITACVVVRQLMAFSDNARLLDQLDVSMLALRQHEERFRSLVQHASDVTALIDAGGRIAYISPAIEQVLGFTPEATVGKPVSAVVHPDDLPTLEHTLAEMTAVDGKTLACELRMRRADGSWRWLGVVSTNRLSDPSVRGIVCNARDVTESLEFQDRLRHEATHDPLTGLANRALFDERLRTASTGATEIASVLIIDLDDFKIVNDTLGHHAGDAVLTAVATRLLTCARSMDTVARLGGDEFAVLLPGASGENGARVAERILTAFAEPAFSDGRELTIKASIGVATGPLADMEALLRAADGAMYTTKQGGKSAFTSVSIGLAA